MKSTAALLGLLGLAGSALADPTWPNAVDEIEEIMTQLQSFRARKFADTVSPCANEASGPGRQNAAEWLRAGFHDMSTANTFFGIGGLDGSLQYELDNGENTGPGHRTTLEFMAPYVSPRSTLADLIALGVHTSVRSCGGPAVPIRVGRIDATSKGPTGVPQPQNSVATFQQQFARMGFSVEEMIQVTACGHTLGGVHSAEFADIVPAGTGVNGEVGLDSSDAVFDNKVVTEYLSGNTQNPLVVGPSVRIDKNSDFKVFNANGNQTMEALADADAFSSVCKTVLQKMIEVVPPAVKFSDPIVPYQIKPVNLQLTLVNGGSTLLFTGFIRVKTTGLAQGSISSVSITYKNRKGTTDCGLSSCVVTSTVQGVSQGFDDTFSFFPISTNILASSGISSFTVTVNNADGTQDIYDNNGNEYPVQDAIVFQAPQSCVLGSSGALTAVAAVRNDRLSQGAQAKIWYKTPQSNSPVPLLQSTTVDLQKGQCVGPYTLFSVDYTIQGGLAYQGYVDVINGDQSDSFKALTNIGGTCRAFASPAACIGGDSGSVGTTGIPTLPATTSAVPTTEPATSEPVTSQPPTTTVAAPTTTVPAPTHRPTVGGYVMVSCWTEGDGVRALAGISYANDSMTLESCKDYCSSYVYWGTEYGRECYCGDTLAESSEAAPIDQCNMVCGGDASEFCGAGNRLELYSTTVTQPPSPTGTLTHKPTVGAYTLVGCWTEGQGVRALGQKATLEAGMTNEACAEFCSGFRYFGTEYGDECYCGSFLDATSTTAPLADCNMPCGGNQFEYCGASNRLELYINPNLTGGSPEQPAAAGDFVLVGCQTEGNGTRALTGAATATGTMSNEDCAAFCANFTYFGTEYGSECYCGNALDPSSLKAPASDCNMLCSGNELEYCGAGNRLSVYTKKPAELT
ncbi:wsc domain containing [Trichoderma cornu-damae]|uniref:Wsc domain containing n=1 Tax=Trichoderma cornu-damae TaxID=654480 RepID=A0A9P8TWZ7_9HYPO|nr:wsc domain containing [Trichoderma cornu-damae]